MTLIADTPDPPYYAVVFTSLRKDGDFGYKEMAKRIVDLATHAKGFLGIESAREDVGITVSYWKDLESIRNWKNNLDHMEAQKLGKEKWYSQYKIRISKVERDYGFKFT